MKKWRKTEVNKSTVLYRHSGLYYVKTILARFCDGLRQISYDFLRLVLDGLRRFLTILAINEINNELRVFLQPCYKTVLNRKESSLNNL